MSGSKKKDKGSVNSSDNSATSEEVFNFHSWNKNQFVFESADKKKTISFNPYYRSDIEKTMTIKKMIKEGCDNIILEEKVMGIVKQTLITMD